MKIFNIENGVHKIYVQYGDLKTLVLDKDTPRTISDLICNEFTSNHYSDTDFIPFTKESDILFFEDEKRDWIIDYRDYKTKSIHDIKVEMYAIKTGIKEDIPDYDENDQDVLRERQVLQLEDIINHKLDHRHIVFPLVPDYRGFKLTSKDNKLEINESLDSNRILTFRKDGKNLTVKDVIYNRFVDLGTNLAIAYKNQNGEHIGKYDVSYTFSNNKKYYITEIKTIKPRFEENQKGIIGSIKRLLYANKKN